MERRSISPPVSGPWLPRRGRDQLKCWGQRHPASLLGRSGLYSHPDGRWGCAGKMGDQAPRPPAKVPVIQDQRQELLPPCPSPPRQQICSPASPVIGGQTPQKGAGRSTCLRWACFRSCLYPFLSLKKKIGILSILDHIVYGHIELDVTLLIILQNAAFCE